METKIHQSSDLPHAGGGVPTFKSFDRPTTVNLPHAGGGVPKKKKKSIVEVFIFPTLVGVFRSK